GASVGVSVDAGRAPWLGGGPVPEATGSRPVVPTKGVFDSKTSDREWFWYGDLTRLGAAPGRPAVEAFYVGHRLEGALYGRGIADETRHSVGGRVWGRPAPWDFSLQAGFPVGTVRAGGGPGRGLG